MMEIHLLWSWMQTKKHEVQQSIREEPDRGDIVQTAIIVGLFAAGAILIVGILVAKGKSAADGVKIQ